MSSVSLIPDGKFSAILYSSFSTNIDEIHMYIYMKQYLLLPFFVTLEIFVTQEKFYALAFPEVFSF